MSTKPHPIPYFQRDEFSFANSFFEVLLNYSSNCGYESPFFKKQLLFISCTLQGNGALVARSNNVDFRGSWKEVLEQLDLFLI